MQITGADIYWLTRLDVMKGIVSGIGFFAVLFGIASVIVLLLRAGASGYVSDETGATSTDKSDSKWLLIVTSKLRYIFHIGFCVLFTLWLAGQFIPSSKEYAAIKVVPVVLNNTVLSETAKEDFGDLYTLSMEWAKEELKALKPSVKEAVTNEVDKAVGTTKDAVKDAVTR